MHLNDICHRDIKCENVLLMSTEPLNIKIADFGFAKMLGPKTLMNPAPGSNLQVICEKQCKEEPLSYGSDGVFSVVSSNCNMNSKLKQKTEQAMANSFCTSTHVLIRCFKNVLTALMKTKNLVSGKKISAQPTARKKMGSPFRIGVIFKRLVFLG